MVQTVLRARNHLPKSRNLLRNSLCAGLVAGTPGTVPRGWDYANGDVTHGVTTTINGLVNNAGVDCLDWTVSGTSSLGTSVNLNFNWGTTPFSGADLIGARPMDVFCLSAFIKLISSSGTFTLQLSLDERDNASSLLNAIVQTITPNSTTQLLDQRQVVFSQATQSGIAKMGGTLRVNYSVGVAFSVRMLIGLPQLERALRPTAPERRLEI